MFSMSDENLVELKKLIEFRALLSVNIQGRNLILTYLNLFTQLIKIAKTFL